MVSEAIPPLPKGRGLLAMLVEILGKHSIISERSVQDLSDLAGFRNILVHRYGDLDNGQVYTILQQDYCVLDTYLGAIQRYLQKMA